MSKKDLIIVIVLIALLPAWYFFDRLVIAPKYPRPVVAEQPEGISGDTNGVPAEVAALAGTNAVETVAIPEVPVVEEPLDPEEIVSIGNDQLSLELTSYGAGIKSVVMQARNEKGEFLYPVEDKESSAPVMLDFSDAPALVYESEALKLGSKAVFSLTSRDERSATFTRDMGTVLFERTIEIGDNYLLSVKDRFVPAGAKGIELPAMKISTGRMRNPADTKSMRGFSILGVDSHTADGDVNYWGRKLNDLYKQAGKPSALEHVVPEEMAGQAVDWVSAKNKFFAQILSPGKAPATMELSSQSEEGQKGFVPHDIAAALVFAPEQIAEGKSAERNYTYYVGPKSYSILKAADKELHMEGVMEFKTIGFWGFMNIVMEPVRKLLLWALNLLYGVFHNYGVAIVLLTVIVRIIFWPLTHKSTEKMRANQEKMQELQPKIKVLQEKYKTNPQKLQHEQMKLYQEHGFNPLGMMGGCLPMFLQMPVLFALYSVLRNAIELRYEGFLWISDLSMPENLLAGHIPVVGALNILPLIMVVSTIFQQKMSTPTSVAATPEQQQQQKMMMYMMPIMMLFFFYTMPSGLVLYWTTSNISMIVQTATRNLRKKKAAKA